MSAVKWLAAASNTTHNLSLVKPKNTVHVVMNANTMSPLQYEYISDL